jgi:hypothetical protein
MPGGTVTTRMGRPHALLNLRELLSTIAHSGGEASGAVAQIRRSLALFCCGQCPPETGLGAGRWGACSAAAVTLRSMPPNTMPWNGEIDRQ